MRICSANRKCQSEGYMQKIAGVVGLVCMAVLLFVVPSWLMRWYNRLSPVDQYDVGSLALVFLCMLVGTLLICAYLVLIAGPKKHEWPSPPPGELPEE